MKLFNSEFLRLKKRDWKFLVIAFFIILISLILVFFMNNKNDQTANLEQAERSFIKGDYDSAIKTYEISYSNTTDNKEKGTSAHQIAQAYISKEEYSDASFWLGKALEAYSSLETSDEKDYLKTIVQTDIDFIKAQSDLPKAKERKDFSETAL